MKHEEFREPPEYLIAHVQEALAGDNRFNQLDISVKVSGRDIVLSGSVQTEERRVAAEEITRTVLPHHNIVNEMRVIDLAGTTHAPAGRTVRLAAVADIHIGQDSHGQLSPHLASLKNDADILLLGGDLTRHGTIQEAEVLAAELANCALPIVAVLGNHDYHSDEQMAITDILQNAGIRVLEGSSTVLDVDGITVGIAGTKGFGGGFIGRCASDFGEQLMKDFIGHTRQLAGTLADSLENLDTDIRVVLMHFSPIVDTLRGEPLELYPWLGSYLFAEMIDHAGADFVFHGHAHAGSEVGVTPAGIPVRNVAQPVIGQAYRVYELQPNASLADITALVGYSPPF